MMMMEAMQETMLSMGSRYRLDGMVVHFALTFGGHGESGRSAAFYEIPACDDGR
jgi:hypothetical protein